MIPIESRAQGSTICTHTHTLHTHTLAIILSKNDDKQFYEQNSLACNPMKWLNMQARGFIFFPLGSKRHTALGLDLFFWWILVQFPPCSLTSSQWCTQQHHTVSHIFCPNQNLHNTEIYCPNWKLHKQQGVCHIVALPFT